MKFYLFFTLTFFYAVGISQEISYDDLVFDEDSAKAVFKPSGKNFVFLKSKKGSGGMDKTPEADALSKSEITDIVLVFSETTKSALAKREDNNRARWENLITTYPSFFQDETNYKNFCQCDLNADPEVFKETQGFYVFYKDKSAKKQEVAQSVETKKIEKEQPVVNNSSKETSKKEDKKAKDDIAKESKSSKESKESKEPKESKSSKESKSKETKKEESKKEELAVLEEAEPATYQPVITKKRDGFSTPKKAKDPKACRPPFYGSGDEDLNIFFKEAISLNKKQIKHIKSDVCVLKLQLNFDGSIKKALVTGANQELNELVNVAVKNMDLWNPAVKGGVTVKSEVKLTLKYDKGTKSIRPFETMIIPKPTPKCDKCLSDAEIFGSN